MNQAQQPGSEEISCRPSVLICCGAVCMQYAGPSETAAIFASLPGSVEVPLGRDDALDPDTIAVPAEAAAGAAEVAMQGAPFIV